MLKKRCLRIATLAHTVYKKCECCDRVKDIYFKLNILDANQASLLVGDIDLCKTCGENLGDILSIKVSTENVMNNFSFERT